MEDLFEFSQDKLPRHVGIVPDGNRRWARERKVDTKIGHSSGYEALNNIIMSFFIRETLQAAFSFPTINPDKEGVVIQKT